MAGLICKYKILILLVSIFVLLAVAFYILSNQDFGYRYMPNKGIYVLVVK